MEDSRFTYNDLYDTPIHPSFFDMVNPTLADLSIDNDNRLTALSQQNHHHHEIFEQGQSNQQNYHHGILQQEQSRNNPQNYNNHGNIMQQGLSSNQQNHQGMFQQGPGQNSNHQNHHGLLQIGDGNNNNNQSFSDPMLHDQDVENSLSSFETANFESLAEILHENQSQPSNNWFSLQVHGNQSQPLNGFTSSQVHGNQSQSLNGFTSQVHGNQNQTGFPSQVSGNKSQTGNGFPWLQNNNDVLPLATWPPVPSQFFCSCCLVLREIIHTNGVQFEKLEIHGRHGFISHAIHNHQNINGEASTYQMIDFCHKSLVEIKNFLSNYCMERTLGGYFMLQDPMSAYYETLCTGMDWIDDINMEEPVPDNQNNSGEAVEQVAENATGGATATATAAADKVNLSEKRKKSGNMTLYDLRDYFHLPIEETSKHVDLCPTVIKKICRKAGLARWPHRKVKSILKQVTVLVSTLNSGDPVARARTEAEIKRLQQEMISHCGDIPPTAMYSIVPPVQVQVQVQ